MLGLNKNMCCFLFKAVLRYCCWISGCSKSSCWIFAWTEGLSVDNKSLEIKDSRWNGGNRHLEEGYRLLEGNENSMTLAADDVIFYVPKKMVLLKDGAVPNLVHHHLTTKSILE